MKTWTTAVVLSALIVGQASAITVDFPSSGSTVVASVGFEDGDEIGSFWSVARGDSVTESFAVALPWIDRAIFNFEVSYNVLYSDPVDWDVMINGNLVGQFSIPTGFTGPVLVDYTFAPIAAVGGSYEAAFVVTNQVPDGAGSIGLGYASPYQHSLDLLQEGQTVIPEPLTAGGLLLAFGALGGYLRRRGR